MLITEPPLEPTALSGRATTLDRRQLDDSYLARSESFIYPPPATEVLPDHMPTTSLRQERFRSASSRWSPLLGRVTSGQLYSGFPKIHAHATVDHTCSGITQTYSLHKCVRFTEAASDDCTIAQGSVTEANAVRNVCMTLCPALLKSTTLN